jgi:RNA polymerase sigma factor (sigma-70 family)|tara:strand:+ start:236 stop:865 length:630 start_codon:yes stop_codon:yes gene_type:complete
MIRAEIRFKNSAFMSALERSGYKSIAEFSRQSGISYHLLIDYANLKLIFKNEENKQTMIKLLDSDEWTLFEQYREVVERENGVNKIVTDIPVDKIISLESKKLLQLESPDSIDESMIKESLEIDVSAILITLKDREKEVLEMFFGINRPFPLILDEIAEELGLSRERVRQIKEKAVRRLRHHSRSERLIPYIGHNRLKRWREEYKEENH